MSEVLWQRPAFEQIPLIASAEKIYESFKGARFPVFRIMGFNDDFPTINIDIKQKKYRQLEFISRADQRDGSGLRREHKVSGLMRLDQEAVPVKLRLKGDRLLHWSRPDRWSFRVEVKNDKSLMGMRRFSLHRAVARNYIYEWVFHALLRHEGLIALRYNFV